MKIKCLGVIRTLQNMIYILLIFYCNGPGNIFLLPQISNQNLSVDFLKIRTITEKGIFLSKRQRLIYDLTFVCIRL